MWFCSVVVSASGPKYCENVVGSPELKDQFIDPELVVHRSVLIPSELSSVISGKSETIPMVRSSRTGRLVRPSPLRTGELGMDTVVVGESPTSPSSPPPPPSPTI